MPQPCSNERSGAFCVGCAKKVRDKSRPTACLRWDVNDSFLPLVGFRSEKAAQICVYFTDAWGSRIDKLALIKLVYIAERESVRRRGRPMIYDECYSLKDGPICRSALDGINGHIDTDIWSDYIHLDGKKDVYSIKDASLRLDELSESDLEILASIVDTHRGKSGGQLRQWTHVPSNVPEYTEVTEKERLPITYSDIAIGVGIKHPADVAEGVREHRLSEAVFPRVK